MIIKPVKELGYDVTDWCITSINVNPNGRIGCTFGVYKDKAEYDKGINNLLAEKGISVEVTPKVFTDLIAAIQESAVAQAGGFFEGCEIQP